MVRKLTYAEIHEKVRSRYRDISCSAKNRFKYPTGSEGLEAAGYESSYLDGMPAELIESFCGVGNPFRPGPVQRGEKVLDVGCGGGVDVAVAGRMTGETGRAYGIDLVPAMAEKARVNLERSGLTNCEILTAGSEDIPFEDNTFDIVISNGALYLSPLKKKTLAGIFRVLKDGGRFQFADVVMRDDIPDDVMKYFNGWSG